MRTEDKKEFFAGILGFIWLIPINGFCVYLVIQDQINTFVYVTVGIQGLAGIYNYFPNLVKNLLSTIIPSILEYLMRRK